MSEQEKCKGILGTITIDPATKTISYGAVAKDGTQLPLQLKEDSKPLEGERETIGEVIWAESGCQIHTSRCTYIRIC